MREIPEAAVDLVAKWEGRRLKAYRDIVGVWTIGYGHTGPEVGPGMTITAERARDLLRVDLEEAAHRIAARIGDVVDDLTDNQYAALLSFVFNLGANPKWTIWKVLKARAFDQVPTQIIRFVYAGGNKVQGLVNRRTDEIRLWSTEEPGSVAEQLPSQLTRDWETPPAPMEKPLGSSKSFVTTIATATAAAPVAVKQVMDAAAPYASQSDVAARIVAALATIAAFLAIAAVVFQWMKHKGAQK